MDFSVYLRRTIPNVRDPDLSGEQPLLSWMTESLTELAIRAPVDVVSIDSSDLSHKYVNFSGRHRIVWDVALNQVLWWLMVGMQHERLANSLADPVEISRSRALASTVFRHTLFSYLAQKLTRFPHTATAFARLASEEPASAQVVPILEGDLIAELSAMQRLLMFYHETTHALHVERDNFRRQAVFSLKSLMDELPKLVGGESALGVDLEIAFPEFAALAEEERLTHFAEELDCDLQAFVFASMALPAAPGIPRRAWQDTIGLLFGASSMLAIMERVLKISVSKWSEFARESSDGEILCENAIVMDQYLRDRPLFYLRRWNTLIALNASLERRGQARGEDAFAWQGYVIGKTKGLIESLDEYLGRELNALATSQFLAKVFARASR